MSELKVYHCNEWHNEYTEFYRKDEVKKVIKKLEESHKREVEQLLMEIVELKKKLVEQATLRAWAEIQLRHNKYKRCLAMAKWCASECVVNQDTYRRYSTHKSEFRIGHFRKWHKRWLELAEKFKEEK